MARVRFEDGTVINFEGTPSPQDIDEAYSQVKGTKTTIQEPPKPQDQFLPGRARVEELRGNRKPITTENISNLGKSISGIFQKSTPDEEARLKKLPNPFLAGAGSLMDIANVTESGLASAGLKAQEGGNIKDIIGAFHGDDVTGRPAQFGDIPRSAGVPEPLSAAIGLGTAMAVPDLLSLGQLKYGKNIVEDSKAIVRGTKATGRVIAKPFKPFKSLKALLGPGQRELGEEITGITTKSQGAKELAKESITGVKEGFQQDKIILEGKLKLANDAFKENKATLMAQLTDDAERGTLQARERLPEWYRANTDTYKAGLEEVARKGGNLSEDEVLTILQDTIDESNKSFLRGPVLADINKLKKKYQPKQAEEGMEEVTDLIAEKGKSVIGWVRKMGGLDPTKTGKTYNISEDFKQFGLGTTLKKGGKSLDDLAQSAIAEGVIPKVVNENPSDTLLKYMKEQRSYGELNTSKLGKIGGGAKTFDIRDVKADIDNIVNSIEYGQRSTSDAIPAYILRKKFGESLVGKVGSSFDELQKGYSDTIETMKYADRYFKPYADPLASSQGVNLLKRFGTGKSKLGEEAFIKKLEKEGVGDITSPLLQTQKSLKLVEEDIAKTRANINTLLETKDISSKGEISKIQTELNKRLDDLEQIKKAAQIKLMNRRQAENLLWYLGIGLTGATQLGRAGRTIRGIGAFGRAGD